MINKITCSLFVLLLCSQQAWSHAGHDEAPGSEEHSKAKSVKISYQAKQNLNISTHPADTINLEQTFTALGIIKPIAGRTSAITSRISGKVSGLLINEGQEVKKGQPLIEIESRQIADPPPRITYNAPFDGIIIDRHAVLGNSVEPNNHLMEIVDLTEVYAEGNVYESKIAALKLGQTVRIKVESYPNQVFNGVLELINGSLDEETHTLKVWAKIKDDSIKLRPNMRAILEIVTDSAETAIAVPNKSILADAAEKFVYVESDQDPLIYERRSVVTGISNSQFTEITQGVFPGDKVVVEGVYQLQYIPAS